jgi:hypothetical protein
MQQQVLVRLYPPPVGLGKGLTWRTKSRSQCNMNGSLRAQILFGSRAAFCPDFNFSLAMNIDHVNHRRIASTAKCREDIYRV